MTSFGWPRKEPGLFPEKCRIKEGDIFPPPVHSPPHFALCLLQGKPRLLLTFSNSANNNGQKHAPGSMCALSLILNLSRLQFIYSSPGIDLKSNFHLACIFWLHFPFLWLLFNVQAYCLIHSPSCQGYSVDLPRGYIYAASFKRRGFSSKMTFQVLNTLGPPRPLKTGTVTVIIHPFVVQKQQQKNLSVHRSINPLIN